jgi:probable F420-dependent oxidoreductase
VRLGFSSMNTPSEVAPAPLARALEERGFESVWFGEHTHIPVSRATPYPAGGEMPDAYRWMMDPYVSLTSAAAATTDLRLGTGVALPLEHDIIALAKTLATLDRLSDGRLLVGVGVGWNHEELANHTPTPWSQRYQALAEAVAVLRTLWCDEESAFHGRFFDFDPVWSLPKPLQQPHPPILCGTGGRLGTRHAVAWADAWMPMDVALGDVAKKLGRFRAAAEEAGRDPAAIPITIVAFGDPEMATLSHYRDLGVERVVVGGGRKGWDDAATTMPFLDRYAELVPELA